MILETNYLFLHVVGVTGLLILNALLVACEFSLIRIRHYHFKKDLINKIKEDRRVTQLLENADAIERSIQLGVVFCTIGIALLLFPVLYNLLVALGLSDSMANSYPIVILSFLLSVIFHYMIGDLIPRGLGALFPIQAVKAPFLLINALSVVSHPIYKILNLIAQNLFVLLKIERRADLKSFDIESRIESIEQKSEEADENDVPLSILKNALQMGKLEVEDILLPRNQVKFFDINDSNEENIKMAIESGHTRFPLCVGDLDQCLGLIHIKDIFRENLHINNLNLRTIKRNILRFEADIPIDQSLRIMLRDKKHMALVIDDFGGTIGVITLDLILEQIVGDIQDEFDREEALIKTIGDNEFIVSGLTPMHELEESLNIKIDYDEISTFGGLITGKVGRIPGVDEEIELENLFIKITEVNEKRVIAAKIRLKMDNELESITS